MIVEGPSPDSALNQGFVTVRDTGMGIPIKEQDDVFKRFYRTAAAGEQAIQGSGLGLSIVKAIVEQHDGAIRLDSVPGTGTTVRIALPGASELSVIATSEVPNRPASLAAQPGPAA